MTAEPARALDVEALRAGAGPSWSRIDVVAETGSTNADLITRAAAGDDPAGAVLIAEFQSAGRGRNGRNWSTAPGAAILMSVGIPASDVPVDGWGWVPLLTGVAVVDAVAAATGVQARLKWPNDVLVDGAKLAGILAEVTASRRTIVVGIGLNVTVAAISAATAAGVAATALDQYGDVPPRETLISAVLEQLADRVSAWRTAKGAGAALVADYTARSATIGTPVRAILPGDREIIGTAVSVDDQGRLHIDTGSAIQTVSAGDIVHLRPTTDVRAQ